MKLKPIIQALGLALAALGVWAAEGKILMRRSVGFVEI